MFEIEGITSVFMSKHMLMYVANNDLHYYFLPDMIADFCLELVEDAIANFADYRFFMDSQGYLVITKKETTHAR